MLSVRRFFSSYLNILECKVFSRILICKFCACSYLNILECKAYHKY